MRLMMEDQRERMENHMDDMMRSIKKNDKKTTLFVTTESFEEGSEPITKFLRSKHLPINHSLPEYWRRLELCKEGLQRIDLHEQYKAVAKIVFDEPSKTR